ncbi:MAG: hypothetical protein HY822_23590, partial [Acidobacteria bacterium]|nr:hypothetical protein [Acidobacteriota bacterium]
MRSRMLLFGVCVGCGWAWAGQPLRLELKWQELESRVARKKVAFTLPDGTRVEGKAIAVQADGLRMKVSKTSDRKAQPKGERVIPRAELSVLRVTSYRKLGRLLGTLGAA